MTVSYSSFVKYNSSFISPIRLIGRHFVIITTVNSEISKFCSVLTGFGFISLAFNLKNNKPLNAFRSVSSQFKKAAISKRSKRF